MNRLLALIRKYQVLFLFLLLELVSFWMVVNYNTFQNASWFNTSNVIAGKVLGVSSFVGDYFTLREQNDKIASENAYLLDEVTRLNKLVAYVDQQSKKYAEETEFEYQAAKVINNSTFKDDNYLTINIGTNDSIKEGMGVINELGVIGKVISVSENYSTVQSVLHSDYLISSQISSTNVIGSSVWKGESITEGHLMYVPRHIKLTKGDTVVTSGYNAVFPPSIPIGVITDFIIPNNESFFDIKMNYTTDFTSLYYVFVVKNKHIEERKEVEGAIETE